MPRPASPIVPDTTAARRTTSPGQSVGSIEFANEKAAEKFDTVLDVSVNAEEGDVAPGSAAYVTRLSLEHDASG